MSSGERIPLAQASNVATAFLALISDTCERIEIAGSIRRREMSIGDVEIVCKPIVKPLQDDEWLGDMAQQVNHLHARLDQLVSDGSVQKRLKSNGTPTWGTKHRSLMFGSFPVDIFMIYEDVQWGAAMAIRTGPADFSKLLVTPKTGGGYMPRQTSQEDFKLWYLGSVIPTPTEDEFFKQLGFDQAPDPQDRRAIAIARMEGVPA